MDGSELERRRKALGLSQTELGERIGIRQPSISAWERGHKPIGNPRMLALALDALEQRRRDEWLWLRNNQDMLNAEDQARWNSMKDEDYDR